VTGPDPAVAPRLALAAFSAGHDGLPVVHGIDLEVGAGEVVALLGPNGAGKTTTLRTVSGLLPRLGGTVDLLGERMSGRERRVARREVVRRARRGVAHVPEDRGLAFSLSGREHLRIAASRGDADAVERALAPFPMLAAIIDRPAGLMSGGEQQMLAIARALATSPALLLVDELSLGLAPMVVDRLLALVRDVARDHDVGVLLVEQHVHAALATADRAAVMVRGRITMSGPAAALAADPELIARSYLGGG
jgi:branched-chain amino acid transport system ATP-binding protein